MIPQLNTRLHDLVEHELACDPDAANPSIAVTAEDGVVMLTGSVPSYSERIAAERIILRVPGVRAVANDLHVQAPLLFEHGDPQIARDAARLLENHLSVPPNVKAIVRNGFVTLEGTVGSMFQRNAAEHAVRFLREVKGVFNDITVQ